MEYRTLHIGKLFRGDARGYDKYIYYILTENGLLKYFISTPGLRCIFVAFVQIDSNNDEVIFVDDVENIKICHEDDKIVASYKEKSIEYNGALYHIKDSVLSPKEANVFNYIKSYGRKISKPIFNGITLKYREFEELVESLDIDSIFESYNVYHTVHHYTTRDDQDREVHEIRSVNTYNDAYIDRFLPKIDFHDRPSVILSREKRNEWILANEILSLGLEQYKKDSKQKYNKIEHIEHLLSDYIYQEEFSFRQDMKLHALAEYADKEWYTSGTFWFCNNYKEDIRKYNQNIQDLLL